MDIDKACEELAGEIIARLSAGEAPPWVRPWNGGSSPIPRNWVTGREYTGLFNPLILMIKGGGDSRWAGASQWKEAGFTIRDGEKPTSIWMPRFGCKGCKRSVKPWQDKCKCGAILRKDGREVEDSKGFIGFGSADVYNASQLANPPVVEGIPEIDPSKGWERASAIQAGSGAKIKHGGDRACYSPSTDVIQLPQPGQFTEVAHYWATSMHELVHWTGHTSRLNRDGIARFTGFGTDVYAWEELVAELGAAFLCHHIGIRVDGVSKGHDAYIGHWIKVLREDPRVLTKVASQASKAVALLLKASPGE